MKGDNIAARLRRLGADVVRLCRALPDDPAARHIARQLVRAATGGGANYEEARGAESRADFIHKLGIANKEVREALYWLQLTQEAALVVEGDLDALVREADELVAILTSSIKTAKLREVTSCAEGRSSRTQDGVRVDHGRPAPSNRRDRIGNREAEPEPGTIVRIGSKLVRLKRVRLGAIDDDARAGDPARAR